MLAHLPHRSRSPCSNLFGWCDSAEPVPTVIAPLEHHLVTPAPGHAIRAGNVRHGPTEPPQQFTVGVGVFFLNEWRNRLHGVASRRRSATRSAGQLFNGRTKSVPPSGAPGIWNDCVVIPVSGNSGPGVTLSRQPERATPIWCPHIQQSTQQWRFRQNRASRHAHERRGNRQWRGGDRVAWKELLFPDCARSRRRGFLGFLTLVPKQLVGEGDCWYRFASQFGVLSNPVL